MTTPSLPALPGGSPLLGTLRSAWCGELRSAHDGADVDLCGWVHGRRDLGGLVFVDVRDRSGIVQVVAEPETAPSALEVMRSVRFEYCVRLRGRVRKRQGGVNASMPTGDVEVAALTLDEVLLLRADGHDARVILILDYSQGADAVVGHPEIADIAALKGKRIGVESTAAGAYLLTRALESGGLSGADVDIVNLGAETQEQAYREGRIDAFATYEPMRTRLLKLGARDLFNSTQIPGEIVDVLVTRGKIIDARPDSLKALAEGWFRAVGYAAAQPEAAARQVAPHVGLTEHDYRRAVEGMRFPTRDENCTLLAVDPRSLRDTVARLHAVMLKTGLLPTATPPGEVFDPRLIRRLGCTDDAGAAG